MVIVATREPEALPGPPPLVVPPLVVRRIPLRLPLLLLLLLFAG